MNENKTKMTILRFIGIWFLPIFFGWKVVKKDSSYSNGWRIWTYIWIGLFTFAIIGGVIKGRVSKSTTSTSYKSILLEKAKIS